MNKHYLLNIMTPAQGQALALRSEYGLENHGLRNLRHVYWNLPTEALYEEIVFRSEGKLTHGGAISVDTGQHKVRAANDKFVVMEPTSEHEVWWGDYNRPFSPEKFNAVFQRLQGFLQGHDLFVRDCYSGADPNFRVPVRIITEQAWHSLFVSNLLIQPETAAERKQFIPDYTFFSIPSFEGLPEIDGTLSSTFILINLAQRLCLICGTGYGGEITKAVFTVLNYLLPRQGVLSMHCAANVSLTDPKDVAIFFGPTGSGKTTLSADPKRLLVGDDEHGWSNVGLFNLEAGCYATVKSLSPVAEPEIYACTQKYGTILENVIFDDVSRELDFHDTARTDNIRAAYPITSIENAVTDQMVNHPRNIIMLTCDALGVMPPIARLTPEQAMYHFISGYSAKQAGADSNSTPHPEINFSACFGAPFMVHHPYKYARMLSEKMLRFKSTCWLVNSGWAKGPHGEGQRISIRHLRALINAALDGTLGDGEFYQDPVFGFEIPTKCDGVPDQLLNPASCWTNPEQFKEQYLQLAGLYLENFKKFADGCEPEIAKAGPQRENFAKLNC